MKKSLRQIDENLKLVEIQGSFLTDEEYYNGVTIEEKLSEIVKEKLGLKQFTVSIGNDFNYYGTIYRYANIETKKYKMTFRFLQFAGNSQSYELPIELI
jgi:hypothetical protein